MTKPKTLDQLRAEKERAETQLLQEQHKLERLENREKELKANGTIASECHADETKRRTVRYRFCRLSFRRKAV